MFLLRHLSYPLFLFGYAAAAIAMAQQAAPLWQRLGLLLAAILSMLLLERLLPYQRDWNRSHGDATKDLLHGLFNTTLSYAGLWLLPWLLTLAPFAGAWPRHWPFWVQVLAAVVLLDAGITLAHYASHRNAWLWRFHAVHHGVRRLYGFNGLMKHPVHQLIETGAGMLPLVLLGIPPTVAAALPLLVAIQLLTQHANVDYRSGPLRLVFCNAELHRFHHLASARRGDVNFGLFFTVWDRLLGTAHYVAGTAPRYSAELGIEGRPRFPQSWPAQMLAPFRRSADER